VAKSIWKGRIEKDTNKEALGSCNKLEGRLCTKEGKDIFNVKTRERGG